MFGYLIRLAPLGIFTPAYYFIFFAALLTLVVLSLVVAIRVQRPAIQRVALVLVVLAIAYLPFAAAFSLKGFEYRVRQTSDASWLKLAVDAQAMLRASTSNHQLPRYPGQNWNRHFVVKLAEEHSVLKLGDFPPKLFVNEDSVSIDWGSGLIGTRAVHISTIRNAAALNPSVVGTKRISDVVTISWE